MEKEEEGSNKKDGEAARQPTSSPSAATSGEQRINATHSAIAAMAAVAAGERSRSNSSSSTSSISNRNNKQQTPPSSSSTKSSSSRKPHDIPSAALDHNLLAAQALFGNPYAGMGAGLPGSPFAFLGQPTAGYPSVTSSASHPYSSLSTSMESQSSQAAAAAAAAGLGMNPAAASAWLNMANQIAAQDYLARLAAMSPGSHPAMFMGHSEPMMAAAAAAAAGFPLDFLAAQHAHFGGVNAKSSSSSSSKISSSHSSKPITSTPKSSNTSTTSSLNIVSNNEDLSRIDPFSQYMKQTTSITGPKIPGTTNRGRKKTISLDMADSHLMGHPSSLFAQFPVLSPQLEISAVERRGDKLPRAKESMEAQGKPEVDLTKLGASSELSVIRLPSGTQKLPAIPTKDSVPKSVTEKSIYGDPRKGNMKTTGDSGGCSPLNLSLKPQDKTEPPSPQRSLGSEVVILDLSSKGKRLEDGNPKTNGDMAPLMEPTSTRSSPSPPFHKPRNLGRGTSKPKKNTVASLLAQSRAMGLQLSSQAAVALANNQVSIMKSSPTPSSPSPTPSPLDTLKNSVEIEMIPKTESSPNSERTVEKPSVTVERLSVIQSSGEARDEAKDLSTTQASSPALQGPPVKVYEEPELKTELNPMDERLGNSSGSSLGSDGSSVSSEQEDDDDEELTTSDGEIGSEDMEPDGSGQKRKYEETQDEDGSAINYSNRTSSSGKTPAPGPGENGKKRRKIVSDEKDLRIPLGLGWKRETQVRSISQSGVIRGEVVYVGPCGKRFKQYPEVLRYLDKNRITNLSREHFSFSTKVLVGDYLLSTGEDSTEETRMSEEQVIKQINQKRCQKGVRLSQLAEKIRKKQMEQKKGGEDGSNMELTEEEKLQQEEEMRKRQKEVEKQRREYLAKLQEKEAQKQQALFLREQERERRRQHMMLVKALETRKRQEERERRREELRAEKRATKERRIQERRLHIRMLEELNKPVEDMKLTDHVPMPQYERINALRLSGKAFADTLMVFEFLHTFGETLGFDMESLPTLSSIQAALLGDEESEEELLSVMGHLLVCAIEDPGVPLPNRHTTLLGHNLKQAEITPHNVSDILRIYFTAIAAQEVKTMMGFTADRKETHTMIEKSPDFHNLATSNQAHRISDWLNKRAFLALNPTQKASILAHICNELLQNKAVVRQIDGTIDRVINLKKKRWSVEQRCKKVKMLEARQLKNCGKSDLEEEPSESGAKKEEYMFESPEKKPKEETEEEDNEAHESGNESEEEKLSGGEEEEEVGSEDVDKKLKELSKECEDIQEQIISSSLHLRALHLGQDRMKRRFWVLASAGGVYMEAQESGIYQQQSCSCKKVKLELEDTMVKKEPSNEIKTEPSRLQPSDTEVPQDHVKPAPNPGLFELDNGQVKQEPLKDGVIVGPLDSGGIASPFDSAGIASPFDSGATASPLYSGGMASPFDSVNKVAPLDCGDKTGTPDSVLRMVPLDYKIGPFDPGRARVGMSDSDSGVSDAVDRDLLDMVKSIRDARKDSQDSKSEEDSSTDNKVWRNGWSGKEDSEDETPKVGECRDAVKEVASPAIVCDSSDPKPVSSAELVPGIGSSPKPMEDCAVEGMARLVPDSIEVPPSPRKQEIEMKPNGEAVAEKTSTTKLMNIRKERKPSIQSEPLGPQNLVNIKDLVESCTPTKEPIKPGLPMMMPNQGLLLNGVSVIPSVYVGQEKWFSVVPRRACDEDTMLSSDDRSPSVSRSTSPEESPRTDQPFQLDRPEDVKPIPEEFSHGWWRFRSESELKALLGSLHPRGIREKELRRLLNKEDFIIKRSFTSDKKRETNMAEVDEENAANEELKTRLEGESILKKLMRSPYEVEFEHGAPKADGVYSWSRNAALRVELTILDQVENLEEKVAGASMQVKGWRVPTRLTTDEEVVFRTSCEDTYEGDTRVEALAASRERLLLLEAAIERRYLKAPLGHSGTINLTTGGEGGEGGESDDVPKALFAWRDAVGCCRSSAQLSMCLSQLESTIAWDKSIMKASCQFCHSGDREEMLLLCDGCDKGYHTYCFKPKMDNIPEGDWYCYECINKAAGERHCLVCGLEDKNVCCCDNCPRAFHPECLVPPLLKIPRGKWHCPACSSIHGRAVSRRGRPRVEKSVEPELAPPDTAEDNSNSSMSTRRSHPRKNSRDMTTCWALVAEMETHEDAWPFLLAVNTKQFPTYKKVIKNPMDLSTIKRKLEEGGYKTREDFLADARLIFDNCETFNEDDSPVGKAGHTMRIFFETKWQELTGGGT